MKIVHHCDNDLKQKTLRIKTRSFLKMLTFIPAVILYVFINMCEFNSHCEPVGFFKE